MAQVDPTALARTFIARRMRESGRGSVGRRLRRLELAQAAGALTGQPEDWLQVEVVDELPDAGPEHVGRLVHVQGVAGGGPDTLNIGVQQADDTVTFVPLNLQLPSDALAFAPKGSLGGSGTGAGQFRSPNAVAVDATGNVFVADMANHRVQRRDATAGTWTTLGGLASGAGNGQFAWPQGIAVDPSGASQRVVVLDTNNSRVQVLTNAIAYSSKFGSGGTGSGQFALPVGVAVAGDGTIYVADTDNHRVQAFNASGTWLSSFGSQGSGAGQMRSPYGVAVAPNGDVWVADSGNYRVQRWSGGSFVSSLGSYGSGLGQFARPVAVAVDGAGRLYVADSDGSRVQVFEGDVPVALFGVYGTGPGQLRYPTGVTVASDGTVYVADSGNDRVSVWGQPSDTSLATYTVVDDFNGGGTTSGAIGELGWIASGAGSVSLQGSTAYHAGIVRIASGGSSGNKHQINFGPFLFEQLARTELVFSPVVTTSVFHRVGLADNLPSPSNGLYVEFDTASGDTVWYVCRHVGGVRTRWNTGIAVAAGSWYRARTAWTGLGAAVVTVRRMDTGQEQAVTVTGVATGATQLLVGAVVQTRTGSARQLDVDAALMTTQNIWRV